MRVEVEEQDNQCDINERHNLSPIDHLMWLVAGPASKQEHVSIIARHLQCNLAGVQCAHGCLSQIFAGVRLLRWLGICIPPS
jgi:hypothetical protein